MQIRTVQLAYAKSGGGIEAYFPKGTAHGTFSNQEVITIR